MSGQDFPLNIFEEFSPSFLHKEKIVRLVIWLRINTQRTDGAACEEKPRQACIYASLGKRMQINTWTLYQKHELKIDVELKIEVQNLFGWILRSGAFHSSIR